MATTKEEEIRKILKEMNLPSYKQYVESYGKNTDKAFEEALTRADTDYANAKSTYGKRASYLLEKGLSASGYSDYLENAAYATRAKTLRSAEQARAEGEADNKSGYAAFLQSAKEDAEDAYEKQEKSTANAFQKLLARHIEDKATAKEYLITLGVDESTAETLAEQNYTLLHSAQTRRNAVLNFVVSNRLVYSRAYKYAIANGLSEDVAREIATISQSAYDVTDFQRKGDEDDADNQE